MSTVKIKRSGTTTSTPSSLDHGELAINYADATLFWKDSSNTIQSFVFQAYASAASPAITGNATFSASSGVPVTITNTGTGNSFVVNDGAGDTTPFVVDADGKVGIRGATPSSLHSLFNTLCVGTGGAAAQGITIFSQSVCTLAFGDTAAGDSADSARGYVSYSHTTDTLTIGTNNATRITVDSTGKVGVNRTSPASALDVNGVITVSATSGSAGSYAPSLTFSGDSNTGFGQVSGQSDTASVFTAGHERVRVKSGGAVRFVPLSADPASGEAGDVYYNSASNELRYHNGSSFIGAAPAASPEFTGIIRSFPSGVFSTAYNSFVGDGVYLSSLNTVAGLGTFGAAISWSRLGNSSVRSAAISSVQTGADSDLVGLAFFVHASSSASADIEEAMRIDHGKRVGIGTESPATALDVNGVITVAATSGSAGSYLPSVTFSGDANTGFGQVSGQSDSASIFTAGHERVRVTSGGNVGIGTASPATPGTGKFSLDVNGPVIARGGVAAHQTSGGVMDLSGDVLRIRAYGSTAGSGVIDFRVGGGGGSADAQGARLDASANFILGSTVSPTGSRVMMLVNGTAPSASIGDCVMLYSEDVSSSAELKVRDEAGNVTTLSPHNFALIPEGPSEPMAWAYYSERDGHKINVDMLRLARLVERLTGEKLVYEAGP